MVHLTNLSRAYDLMVQLSDAAAAAGFKNVSAAIGPEKNGEIFFSIRGIGAPAGNCFLRGMETDDPDTFYKKAETFRAYWLDLIETAKETNAVRIAQLKAEIARLEGRA
jgi:hypothetical protein